MALFLLRGKGIAVGDANNLIVGTGAAGSDGTGLAWFAATGTTAPTDATTALNAGFKDAGLIAEDGVTGAFQAQQKKIKAYGSTLAQRIIVTDEETTFQLKFLEVNEISMAVWHRKALTAITPAVSTGAFSVTTGLYSPVFYSAVFDVIDGTNHIRMFCPKVEKTNTDNVQFSNGNEVSWGVTLTAYPVSGVAVAWYYAIPSLG